VACSLIALALFLVKSFIHANSEETSPAEIVTASEKRLQLQINDLSSKISAINNTVTQLQSQPTVTGIPTASPANQQQISNNIDAITADTQQLSSKIDSLQAQVATLQDKLTTADTAIGITPIILNGLSITFITNNIELEMTGAAIPSAGQFAIKIANTTSTAFTNVDITGTITSSQNLTDDLAPGYPQLADGAGLCSYVFFMTQYKIMNFEAFGVGKTALSIPAGGSIILRPKISLLAAVNEHLPAISFSLALKNITYDIVTTTK
jgi:hypothetical protein